jgi:hypothetical protein
MKNLAKTITVTKRNGKTLTINVKHWTVINKKTKEVKLITL